MTLQRYIECIDNWHVQVYREDLKKNSVRKKCIDRKTVFLNFLILLNVMFETGIRLFPTLNNASITLIQIRNNIGSPSLYEGHSIWCKCHYFIWCMFHYFWCLNNFWWFVLKIPTVLLNDTIAWMSMQASNYIWCMLCQWILKVCFHKSSSTLKICVWNQVNISSLFTWDFLGFEHFV